MVGLGGFLGGVVALGYHVVRWCSMCRITRAAEVIRPMLQGQRLTLRRALKGVLSSEFTRSPIARSALWARLNCCCTSVQARFFGFLNATVIVAASPA